MVGVLTCTNGFTSSIDGEYPGGMESTTREAFCALARALQAEAVRLRLLPPVFRDQPHVPGENRTLRRTRAEQVVVAVNRWRPEIDVASDMIAGVLAANRLTGDEAELVRAQLWQAAGIAVDA